MPRKAGPIQASYWRCLCGWPVCPDSWPAASSQALTIEEEGTTFATPNSSQENTSLSLSGQVLQNLGVRSTLAGPQHPCKAIGGTSIRGMWVIHCPPPATRGILPPLQPSLSSLSCSVPRTWPLSVGIPSWSILDPFQSTPPPQASSPAASGTPICLPSPPSLGCRPHSPSAASSLLDRPGSGTSDLQTCRDVFL